MLFQDREDSFCAADQIAVANLNLQRDPQDLLFAVLGTFLVSSFFFSIIFATINDLDYFALVTTRCQLPQIRMPQAFHNSSPR
jgi:hypothetical protein